MNHQFTEQVQQWLQTPKGERDLAKGAQYLLQLSNNPILFRNISANLEARADALEYHLKKYVNFRLQDLTHEQVAAMQTEVDAIVKRDKLDVPTTTKEEKAAANAEFKKGMRTDHDTLPKEVQALYKENLSLLQKMRRLHTKLSLLSIENTTCPDSERYPFLKELIEYDKQYHANWKAYDSYGK